MPTVPLPSLCNIWRFSATLPPPGPPVHANLACFLQDQRTMGVYNNPMSQPLQMTFRFIYVPKRTDVRVQPPSGTTGDTVELPAGSNTWYRVVDVQDYHRDLPDELRRLVCYPIFFPSPRP